MPYYSVKYTLGKNNEFIYPESITGVVWKSTINDFDNCIMIGETDEHVPASGKEVVSLKTLEAHKLEEKYRSMRPKLKKTQSDLIRIGKIL